MKKFNSSLHDEKTQEKMVIIVIAVIFALVVAITLLTMDK